MSGAHPQRHAGDLRLDALQRRVDEADDLAAEHETVLREQGAHVSALLTGQRLLAEQVAGLDLKMDRRFEELESRMPAMLADTARGMVRDPEEWAAALGAAREGAAKLASQATGNAVMRMFKSAALSGFKFLLALALLYYSGGLKAVLAFITLKGSTP